MDGLLVALIVVMTVVTVLALAAVARRLLNLRFGVVRTVAAGVVGFLMSQPIVGAFIPPDGVESIPYSVRFWVIVLSVITAVLAAMVVLAVAEALAPTGSIPGPVEAVRGLRRRVLRTRRYLHIMRIAVRHGLGPYLRGSGTGSGAGTGTTAERLARSLREALEEGGVTFVKLGQILSTRRDLLPPEFIDELGRLRDNVAPAPWPEVERTLAAELGAPVDEVFAAFDREPLAAASIAQVHAARLRSGEDVVVKVRRPGIEDVVARDLDIVDRLARTIATRTRWGHAIGVRELADGFAEALREELDFRVEADNMVAVAAASAAADGGDGGAPGVRVPAPHLELCSRRVLVMERLSGTSLAAAGDVIARLGLDPGELAGRLLRSLLRQIMVDGVFHADPHPGNVLLLDDGRLALLDFGSVGRLDVALREALRRLLLALDRGDPLAVTDVLLEIAARPEEIDQERLERALGQFLARHLGAGQTPGVRMFTDLFRIVAAYGLSVPAEVAAVFRALATVEGALASLSPGFDIVAEARAFGDAYLAERLGPEAAREMATRELLALLPMLRRLPRRVDRILSAAEHGRFAVNVRLLADERDRGHVAAMLHQVLITVLAATGGLMAVLLLGIDSGPRMTDAVGLYEFLGYNLLVISMILALRVLAGIFRRSGGA